MACIGDEHKNNTYQLNVGELAADKPVTLVMEVEPVSSNNTAGVIEIHRKEDGS